MTASVLIVSSLLTVFLIAVLAREIRLRTAMQRLLSRLLIRWRTPPNEADSDMPQAVDPPSYRWR